MARFLVTGGAGFIGSHLIQALLDEGHMVRVLDDFSSGHRKNVPQQVELIEADVTDPAAVDGALDDVDGCFHLAAIASVLRSHREWLRTHQVNLTGTINVFDQARPSRRGREVPIVYASTAAIYGNCGSFPVDEESPAGRAYHDAVARFLGEQREMRFLQPERRSFFRALFGRA